MPGARVVQAWTGWPGSGDGRRRWFSTTDRNSWSGPSISGRKPRASGCTSLTRLSGPKRGPVSAAVPGPAKSHGCVSR